MKKNKIIILLLCGIPVYIFSLCLGNVFISPFDIPVILESGRGVYRDILMNIRIPRILMATIAGASLSVSGAVFQALLKNPLADPFIIGSSSGAAFGASIAMVCSLGDGMVMLFAFAGSVATVSVVYLVARRNGFASARLILSGMAMGFILSSAVMLVFSFAESGAMHRALMWLMGDLSLARFDLLTPASSVMLVLFLGALALFKHLNVISMGDGFSRNLGVTGRSLGAAFWISSLMVALCVSLCGTIGFVGLIMPHVMRRIFGPDHLKLLPASAFGGAVFLTFSDAVGRSIAPPYEIPVGIITGFMGGIFFLLFIARGRDWQ